MRKRGYVSKYVPAERSWGAEEQQASFRFINRIDSSFLGRVSSECSFSHLLLYAVLSLVLPSYLPPVEQTG